MYHDLQSVRANIDFYEIYTTQLLPSYKSITDNINRLKNKLTPKQSKQAQQQWKKDQSNTNWYQYDARNPEHARLSWTACTADYCPAHYSNKQGAGQSPRHIKGFPQCKQKWFKCKNDLCPKHLQNKRETVHFLGNDNLQRVIQMQTTHCVEYVDDYYNNCNKEHQQTCLSNICDKHKIAKDYYRYSSKKPFLRQRHSQKSRLPLEELTQ